tara:strand:+ start:589 stop:1365 length:777 start_codon:yes stop_codon:yes gene_type:complete
MKSEPKVSIITVAFNSSLTIRETIESVLNQTYKNIEYIIIDGGSEDNTMEIIKTFKEEISYVISEKDEGIYDGMNKGIKIATGEIIGILNSDDKYFHNNIITEIVNNFIEKDTDTLYGDLIYVDTKNPEKVIRYWESGIYNKKNISQGWMIPHPTFFVKKEIYNKYGMYSNKLRSAADYEMMIRLLYKNNCSVSYIPKILVKMRTGGYSNQSIWNRLKANNEDVIAWKINGLVPPKFLRFFKPFLKINQFIKKPKFDE